MKNKKVLYLYQFFRHPGEPGGTRAYWIARKMVENGYDVTMVTQRNTFNEENKNTKFVERITIDGIQVVYIKNGYFNGFSYPRRIYSFLRFMLLSSWFALREKNVDIVVATSTPLTIAFPALLVKKIRNIPMIFEVRDLWPEVPIQMRAINNRLLIMFLKWFEKATYKNSDYINTLSPGMQEGVSKYISPEKISMIPNMAKIDKFWPRNKDIEMQKRLNLSDKSFKIIHFGAMGIANGLENYLDAASLALEQGISDIEFVLVGNGKMKPHFDKRKSNENLINLHIFDRMPMERISSLVNICDISYIGFLPKPILETNSANKFFDSLSAGKPILLNFGGWMQELVEKNKCGLRVHPTDGKDLLEKIIFLKANPEKCEQMGQAARKMAETEFDKSILTQQFLNIVDKF